MSVMAARFGVAVKPGVAVGCTRKPMRSLLASLFIEYTLTRATHIDSSEHTSHFRRGVGKREYVPHGLDLLVLRLQVCLCPQLKGHVRALSNQEIMPKSVHPGAPGRLG